MYKRQQQYEREFDYRVNAKAQEITAPIQQSCECALKDYNNRIANIDNAVEEQMRLYIESQKNEDTPEMKRVKQFLASRVSSKTKKSELDVYNEYAQHHPLAVSYTHLDVYKRQGVYRGRSAGRRLGGLAESDRTSGRWHAACRR